MNWEQKGTKTGPSSQIIWEVVLSNIKRQKGGNLIGVFVLWVTELSYKCDALANCLPIAICEPHIHKYNQMICVIGSCTIDEPGLI